MVKGLNVIERASHKKKLGRTVRSRIFEVVGPYKMRERWEEINEIPDGCMLLKTRLTGICHADLRYVSCSRPPEILRERLPLCVLHEGIAEVAGIGEHVHGFRRGDLVVVVPNIPCYVHDPERYPDIYRACRACRPGGAGENLCEDVRFLASNAHGLCRTSLVHPASCAFAVPPEVPEEAAVLTEPLTVIKRAVKQASVDFDDKVAVLGGGVMGFFLATVLSRIVGIPKRNLLVTDIFDFKLEKFTDFATAVNTKEKPLGGEFLSSFDVAFECAGGKAAEATIDQALSLLSSGGMCLLVGVSEGKVPTRTRKVLEKGLTLKGTTRSAAIDYPEVLEWLRLKDFRKILKRIVHPEIFSAKNSESIISACKTAENPKTHGKVLIDWRQKAGK